MTDQIEEINKQAELAYHRYPLADNRRPAHISALIAANELLQQQPKWLPRAEMINSALKATLILEMPDGKTWFYTPAEQGTK